MFCPVDLKQEEKDLAAAEQAKWKSSEGWVYPGVKSTRESNQHAKRPDPARLDELNDVRSINSLNLHRVLCQGREFSVNLQNSIYFEWSM